MSTGFQTVATESFSNVIFNKTAVKAEPPNGEGESYCPRWKRRHHPRTFLKNPAGNGVQIGEDTSNIIDLEYAESNLDHLPGSFYHGP